MPPDSSANPHENASKLESPADYRTLLEAKEQQQAAIAQLGIAAASGADVKDVLHQAVEAVAHTLSAEYCKVLKYRPETDDFLLHTGVGWTDGLVGEATVSGSVHSQAGYTLMSDEPVVVPATREESRFEQQPLLVKHGVQSGMSCVIRYDGNQWGVLGVHSRQPRSFSAEDIDFFQSVAHLCALAIRRAEACDRLAQGEEHFRTLANSIPQLAWMADPTGHVFWYNQRWYDYTGTSLEEMEGWQWQKVHHPDHVDHVVQSMNHAYEHGTLWEDTFPLRSKDGSYRWFLSRAQPIRDAKGDIIRWFGTNTDITDQREADEEIRKSQSLLDLAREAASLGVYDYNPQTQMVRCDGRTLKIWEKEGNEFMDVEELLSMIYPEDRELVDEALANAWDPINQGKYFIQYRVVTGSGKIVWVEATGAVIFKNGNAVRMTGTVQDITERKNNELALEKAVAELEAADRRKDEFLAVLGHELRNPLAAVSNCIQLLKTEQSPMVEKVYPVMQSSMRNMQRLLDDLLDLGRMTQDRISLQARPMDLAPVLVSCINFAQTECMEKNLELTSRIVPNLFLQGDRTRLEQIFGNLITNALRYTPRGGHVRLEAGRDGERITVSLRDDGIGIEASMLEEIFETFVQANPGSSGLGIGLALCRQLVRMHGGEISAESEGAGKGAVFRVSLPALPVGEREMPLQLPDATQEGMPVACALTSGLEVLIIEDEEELILTLGMILRRSFKKVHQARSGREGIELALARQPDIALVDIGLGDMDGYQVAQELRSKGLKCCLIAHSGYSHDAARQRSLEAGFDFHIAKPMDYDLLYRNLDDYFSGRRNEPSAES